MTSALARVLVKVERASQGPGRRGARVDGSLETATLRACRYGRTLVVALPGQRERLFDMGTPGMARFLFAELTKVA